MPADSLTILVGTTKGAFLISGGNDGSKWTVKGPFCGGWPINHAIADPETGTIWAGGRGGWNDAGVRRSRDGGESWLAIRNGLPQEACYFTVLCRAMAGDERDPVGIYFGINSGSVFGSIDEGDNWHEIARHLPPILGVEVLDHS